MVELSRIDVLGVGERSSPKFEITATVYECDDNYENERVQQTSIFQRFADAKSWLDKEWKELGLDECWNDLFVTRIIGEGEDALLIGYRMELLMPEGSEEPFNLHDTKNQPRLVFWEINEDEGTRRILTFGMASGVSALEREDVPQAWSVLFQDNLTFDDIHQLCEFGIKGD
jgi:hypothetical protein